MPYRVHDRRWRILSVLCIAVFLVVVDNTVVNVALPSLSRDMRASDSALQWIGDGYSLPFAGLLLAGGGVSDRLGRKRVLQFALIAFAVFSLLAAYSNSIATLLSARALMGASAAFIFPAILSLVTVIFEDPKERATAFGIWGAAAGGAIAVGPVVGGALITHSWFGSIFLFNIPIAVVGVVATVFVVPESKSAVSRPLDLGGLFFGTTGVTSLVLAIIEGPSWGWRATTTLSLFVLSAILLVLFTRHELRREGPLLDVRIFRNGAFSAGAGAIATIYFCLFGFIFLITQYFQLVRGYSALSAGVHTLPFAAVTVVATPLGALGALRVGTRYVVVAGLALVALALAWVATIGTSAAFFGPVIGAMMVLALGFSLVSAPSTAVVMGSLSPEQVGAGAAGNETTRELGGTLGVAVIGSVFSSLFGPQVRRALAHLGLSAAQLGGAQRSMQAAQATVAHLPAAVQVSARLDVTNAFMTGLHRGCLVAALTATVAAIVIFRFLPNGRSQLPIT
ncbi:MFS transporter [Acidithrix ferrooxidans]|uniref:Antiseptic resistance protein n=1 Tax=Acidithrix ferrooxidans TaxID=1280514 RepID=A0A0D8HHI6_9ACTN|nr:MFS transporter [Acidithrix ferrooxidans]KJF17445.1 antiseptic resistance protein [Acidithrix ferrooxidans]